MEKLVYKNPDDVLDFHVNVVTTDNTAGQTAQTSSGTSYCYPYYYYYPSNNNAFKIAKALVAKKIVSLKSVKGFIELVEAIEKEL